MSGRRGGLDIDLQLQLFNVFVCSFVTPELQIKYGCYCFCANKMGLSCGSLSLVTSRESKTDFYQSRCGTKHYRCCMEIGLSWGVVGGTV